MSLKSRLDFDKYNCITKLCKIYLESRDVLDTHCKMSRHFEVVRNRPRFFADERKALGISIGGSNTKFTLLQAKNNAFYIESLLVIRNPDKLTKFHDFLDETLGKDNLFRHYLKGSGDKLIGFSIPVVIIDNVPYHPVKVGTVSDFIARTKEEITPRLDFDSNIARYFNTYGVEVTSTYKNRDSIMGHIGGFSILDIKPEQRSVSLVCGTGIAACDDDWDIVFGMLKCVDEDRELYPPLETENNSLSYFTSGKGIYGIMKRAIAIKSSEHDSRLGEYELDRFFSNISDSKIVFDLWGSLFDAGSITGKARDIFEYVGKEAFQELQQIASLICEKACCLMAGCIICCFFREADNDDNEYHVILEGSIANNKFVKNRINWYLNDQVLRDVLKTEFGLGLPSLISDARQVIPVIFNPKMSVEERNELDYSTIGAAISVMAEVMK